MRAWMVFFCVAQFPVNGLDLSPYVVKDPGTGVGAGGGEGNSRLQQQQQQQEQQPQQLNHHGQGHQRAKEDAPEASPLSTAASAAAAAASAGVGVVSGAAAAPAASAYTNGAVYGKTAKEGVGGGVGERAGGGSGERLARPFFLSGSLDDLDGGGGNEGSDNYARSISAAARAAGAADGAAGDGGERWRGEGEGDAMFPETVEVEAGAETGNGAGMGNPGVIGANVSIFQELALVLASTKLFRHYIRKGYLLPPACATPDICTVGTLCMENGHFVFLFDICFFCFAKYSTISCLQELTIFFFV